MAKNDVAEYISGELQRHVDAGKALTDRAITEGRVITDDERSEIEIHVKAAGEYKAQLASRTANDELRASIDALGVTTVVPGGGDAPEPLTSSLGSALVNSKTYKALLASSREGDWNTEPMELPYLGMKANETVVSTNVELVNAPLVPGIVGIAKQPTTLVDIIPQAVTDSNRVPFMIETVATNNAAKIAELGAHVQSILQFDTGLATVYKTGTLLYVSEEILEDVSGMQSYIDGRLGFFVSADEEELCLNAQGSTTIDGLLHQTTQTQPIGGDTIADAIYKAKTQVRTGSFLEPTHVIVNATDWETIRLAKDGNDNYLNGLGPFVGGDVEPPVWGLRPIITSRIAAGTLLVGAFNAGALQMFRKRGVVVTMSNSNASLFETGQVTIKASSRFALVVYRPAAFCEVNL